MSDFIYSSSQQPKDLLKISLQNIHIENKPLCTEFHGNWGSLAVLKNQYPGFEPFENSDYIIYTAGGPLLNFPYEIYNGNSSKNYMNHAILDKWKYKKNIRWEDDLSGPFAIICIDKTNKRVEFVTDLLSFIPVYHTKLKNDKENIHFFGTHNDVTARVSGREKDIDFVSVADMLINTSIIFPYTFHKDVNQLLPSSVYHFDLHNSKNISAETYWLPYENYIYKNINEAASHLRESYLSIVKKITEGLNETALFLSGGEDSRVVLASIPKDIKKHAFIFLDSLNREGKIAQKVAKIHNTELKITNRPVTYYLDNMEAACALLGTQYNFTQLHTLGFHKSCRLDEYQAVLGGFFSDGLIKGIEIPQAQVKLRKYVLFNSILTDKDCDKSNFSRNNFSDSFIEEISERHKNLSDLVRKFRSQSLCEWKNFWPISNKEAFANFAGNRRLFRSYEPTTHSEIIKILASVPQEWKVNRKLYHKAFKPLLGKTWYIPHGENAHYPYFSTFTNVPLKLLEASRRKIFKYKDIGNQGPWTKWNDVINTDLMAKKINYYSKYFACFSLLFKDYSLDDLFKKKLLNSKQMLIFLQLLYIADISKPLSCKGNSIESETTSNYPIAI